MDIPPATDRYLLRAYEPADWPAICEFTKATWREDHPMTDRSLFEWQFQGFGNHRNPSPSIVLMDDDKILGFRGVIPGLYQMPNQSGGMDVLPGGSLAMWMLRPACRGLGLGKRMHQYVQQSLSVLTGAGSNPETSVPIYRKNGFSVLSEMARYIVPLCPTGYSQLLSETADAETVETWARAWRTTEKVEPLAKLDVDAIAQMWRATTFPLRIFALYRSSEFWNWRYVHSRGFEYLFFGDPSDAGIVVARIEHVLDRDDGRRDGLRVLRVIEVLPCSLDGWQGRVDEALTNLLRGVLAWAAQQQCVAADFSCTSKRFTATLKAAGFRQQDFAKMVSEHSLAVTFQPLSFTTRPINALYRIQLPSGELLRPSFEDTYFVKSHNDMDRPAILGQRPDVGHERLKEVSNESK